MKKSKVTLCSTCVRNITSSYIGSEDGECVFCKNFRIYKKNLSQRLDEIKGKFFEELKTTKSRGVYDCLIMLSGGKDSTTALYKLKKETELRVLGYTIDNNFELPEAMMNIKRAVEKLKVDWLIDKPAYIWQILKIVLRERVKISICRFCAHMIVNRAIKIAQTFQIPIIITGWNKGQSDKEPSRLPLWKFPDEQLKKLAQKYPFMNGVGLLEKENEELLKKFNIKVLSPWIFYSRNSEENMRIIKKELGWKKTVTSYPKNSTSCSLNLLQVILSRKYFGYTHYDCEESMLIKYGEKTRAEAIKILDYDINTDLVFQILKSLDLKLEDVGLKKSDLKRYSKFYF